MVVRYSETIAGKRYELRTAGRSTRLYTNGAFHSQYHPDRLFTGAIWDLLSLPSIACSHSRVNSMLVLGVGGGTVIHQVQALHGPESIVGVELDAQHLALARRYFSLDYPGLQLLNEDAVHFLKTNRRKFDLVVDDVFTDAVGDPERPAPLTAQWMTRLQRALKPGGVLVQNHLTATHANHFLREHKRTLQSRFESALAFETPTFENRVIACFPHGVTPKSATTAITGRVSKAHQRMLRFKARQVF